MDTITIIDPKNKRTIPDRLGIKIDVDDLSKISDGYHTIAELYDHGIELWIALCRSNQAWFKVGYSHVAEIPGTCPVWRSKLHSDGSSFDGWFLLGIDKEKGKQMIYHVPNSRWNDTSFAETLEKAPEFDGHTSADVLKRLKKL